MRLVGLVTLGFIALAGPARATLVNFDDGAPTAVIDAFYSPIGVIFSGATWQPNLGLAGFSGALGLGSANANAYKFGSATPVIATFSHSVFTASVRVLDLGENGFTLKAYDAPTGGNLVSTTTLFGIALGNNNFQTLTVNADTIFRVEMFQVQDISIDGIVVENFQFTVPEPGMLMVLGASLVGLRALRRRRQAA